MDSIYYIYIMKCAGDRLYTGYTSDPKKRFNEHRSGKGGAKFTRGFTPVSIEGLWEITGTKGDAMKIEAFIKSLKKAEKIQLIEKPSSLLDLISERFTRIELRVSEKISLSP
ncbi:MAG TPA: GIY-YIG nuclease family protein [Spirochaetota bacterium]|nr:GIY-YIG nuclease family protein [Spirochaetota bacterium]HPJ43496.1 GIY-YIG nuclease family protein [Spirochaetota bacterium]HRX46952.1 GIY-YIG nuclease family protein [Spirochaetota bacterium]